MVIRIAFSKRFLIATTLVFTMLGAKAISAADTPAGKSAGRVEFKIDEGKKELQVLVDGKEAVVYKGGADLEMAYYYPVRSPSGKPLTVERTEPYPHHRSFWFADTVQPEGERRVSFYESLYSNGKKNQKPPFKDHIRHVGFTPVKDLGGSKGLEIGMKLVWEMDGDKPVIDEQRTMRVAALGDGEYLLDLGFTVTPSSKPVKFISDSVHYAWPYIRIDKRFSVEGGGTMAVSKDGKQVSLTGGEKAEKPQKPKKLPASPALWIDYSNQVDGETEGLAMFAFPQDGKPPLWLARDYGTFGPRRIAEQSGKPFTLKVGESLTQRVGVLVHRGDATDGKVAERYAEFVGGKQ